MKCSKKTHVQSRQIFFPSIKPHEQRQNQKNFNIKKQFAPYTMFKNPYSPKSGQLGRFVNLSSHNHNNSSSANNKSMSQEQ